MIVYETVVAALLVGAATMAWRVVVLWPRLLLHLVAGGVGGRLPVHRQGANLRRHPDIGRFPSAAISSLVMVSVTAAGAVTPEWLWER